MSPQPDLPAAFDQETVSLETLADRARAYRSDWRHFEAWCQSHHMAALPAVPETVALYLTALAADHKPATLQRRLTSITRAHRAAGFSETPSSLDHAVVSETWKGIRRTVGTAQPGKEPLLTDDVLHMLDMLADDLAGRRDRALLLVGFAGGFRRSELVGLDVADSSETADGLVIRIRRSKTDPEARGAVVALPYGSTAATCPVRSYLGWITAAGITTGPAFRSVDRHGNVSSSRMNAGSVARLVKRAAERAGMEPTNYAGHSLRAGFATQAFLNGVAEVSILRQTRHKSLNTLRKYIRDRLLFRDNPAAKLGL